MGTRVGVSVLVGGVRVGNGRAVGGCEGVGDGGSPQHEGRGEGFVAVAGGDDDGGGLAHAAGARDGVQTQAAEEGRGGRFV